MITSEIIKSISPKMDSVILILDSDLKNIRTGRANSALVEDIVVSYFGVETPLKQLASITIPDATQIVVQPWDKQSLGDIEIALKNSELNLSVTNDGKSVRISLPPMTGERRDELSKIAKKHGEDSRVAIRNIRSEVWEKIQSGFRKGDVTEDDKYRGEKELNDLIDRKNGEIESRVESKIAELSKI
jgi:ribosome recycling factor